MLKVVRLQYNLVFNVNMYHDAIVGHDYAYRIAGLIVYIFE